MSKILILIANPTKPSFRQRVEICLSYFKDAGIDCDVKELPKNYIQRWKLFKSAKKYDAVFLLKKTLNITDALILRKFSKKIIFDFDDAIMYTPHNPESNRTSHGRLFRRTVKMADFIIAGNRYLADHAKKYCNNVQIIPTGLDTQIFNKFSKEKNNDKIRLVWIGSKKTIPYLVQIKPALETIGKKYNNVVLRIICNTFFELENMPVEKCQWSLETQVPGLVNSDIGLAPLPDDRFTRGKCGFKILQYFAAGLPVVASPVGVNEDFVIDDKTGFCATTNEQWVEGLSKLIEDKNKRIELSKNAKYFSAGFDQAITGGKLVRYIKDSID